MKWIKKDVFGKFFVIFLNCPPSSVRWCVPCQRCVIWGRHILWKNALIRLRTSAGTPGWRYPRAGSSWILLERGSWKIGTARPETQQDSRARRHTVETFLKLTWQPTLCDRKQRPDTGESQFWRSDYQKQLEHVTFCSGLDLDLVTANREIQKQCQGKMRWANTRNDATSNYASEKGARGLGLSFFIKDGFDFSQIGKMNRKFLKVGK